MNKPKKRGRKSTGITKVTRKYTLDAEVVSRLESRYKDGEKSRFVNDAIDEKLKREEQK
jgi:hypothetical protein